MFGLGQAIVERCLNAGYPIFKSKHFKTIKFTCAQSGKYATTARSFKSESTLFTFRRNSSLS